MPKVSIVVPVYNVETFLPECLRSLEAQTFRDFEVLLVDDGSTDASGAILDQFAKANANFRVTHQENAGVCAARATAIRQARGDYLGFVDSDDCVSPEYLAAALQAAESNGADIVCFQRSTFWDGDETAPKPRPPKGEEKTYRGKSACFGALFTREFCFYLTDKLFRRELFDDLRMPALRVFEDSYLLPAIFARAECVALLPKRLYFYRMRAESLSHIRDQSWTDAWLEAANQAVLLAERQFPEHLKRAEARVNITRLRCMDSILECPQFRRHPCWKSYSRYMRKWLPEILRADKSQVRFLRKLYALMIVLCPDLAALLAQKKGKRNQALLTIER